MKVAVSQRVDYIESYGETRDVLDQRLAKWLLQVGVLAVPVPNSLQLTGNLLSWLASVSPQAVILSGGNDVGKCPSRDCTETAFWNILQNTNCLFWASVGNADDGLSFWCFTSTNIWSRWYRT